MGVSQIEKNADALIAMGKEAWLNRKEQALTGIMESLNTSYKQDNLKRTVYQLVQKDKESGLSCVVDVFNTHKEAIEACEWENFKGGEGTLYYTIRSIHK